MQFLENDKKIQIMKNMAKAIARKKCKDGETPKLKPGKEGTKSSDYICTKIDKERSKKAKLAAKKNAAKRKLAALKAAKTRIKNDKIRQTIKVESFVDTFVENFFSLKEEEQAKIIEKIFERQFAESEILEKMEANRHKGIVETLKRIEEAKKAEKAEINEKFDSIIEKFIEENQDNLIKRNSKEAILLSEEGIISFIKTDEGTVVNVKTPEEELTLSVEEFSKLV